MHRLSSSTRVSPAPSQPSAIRYESGVVCIVFLASDIIFRFVNGHRRLEPIGRMPKPHIDCTTDLSSKHPPKIKLSSSNSDTKIQTGKSKPTSSIRQEPHGQTISVSESFCQLLTHQGIIELYSLLTLPEKLSV